MPEPLTTYNQEILTTLNELGGLILNWKNQFISLGQQINAGYQPGVTQVCGQLHDLCILWAVKLRGIGDFGIDLNKSLNWIDENWSGGNGDVTMDAILNAMLSAEYNELQQFVGIVDGYRVALWDGWFNTEFYAALARGFKQLKP